MKHELKGVVKYRSKIIAIRPLCDGANCHVCSLSSVYVCSWLIFIIYLLLLGYYTFSFFFSSSHSFSFFFLTAIISHLYHFYKPVLCSSSSSSSFYSIHSWVTFTRHSSCYHFIIRHLGKHLVVSHPLPNHWP